MRSLGSPGIKSPLGEARRASAFPGGLKPGLGPLRGRVLKDMEAGKMLGMVAPYVTRRTIQSWLPDLVPRGQRPLVPA